MSQKWRRSQEWDRTHFPTWAQPVRWVLHAFSTITLAVCLLSFVVVYAILASVPIGLLAQIPTYLVYGVSAVLVMGAVGVGLVWLPRRLLRRAGRGLRFSVSLVGVAMSIVLGAWLWREHAWPVLHYDPASGRGLMLFADFVKEYSATTLRRLPGVEMSELEFYSWWPLRIVLLAFVANMVTATVRRIEFKFENLGVLTVHTGIVVIALGSVYYTGLKKEGDTILFAGNPTPAGETTIGPPSGVFYDNTRVALFIDQFKGWEQRPLRGVPRYNDYGIGGASLTLDVPVIEPRTAIVDHDIRFSIVGYASYAELRGVTERAPDEVAAAAARAGTANPLRVVELLSFLPDQQGKLPEGPVHAYRLEPRRAAGRASSENLLSVEYTIGMDETRWRDLLSEIPTGTRNALSIEIPAKGYRAVLPVSRGATMALGDTGYVITVEDLTPEPPFPIITKGYEGATSSVAIVRVTPPAGAGGEGPFTRWIYSRFPEISQDMLDTVNAQGMPTRRDADASIRIGYIDANTLSVNIDEREDGSCRAIVRLPNGEVRVTERVGETLDLVPGRIAVRIAERWAHTVTVERPEPTPEPARERQFVGTHDHAVLGVKITADLGATSPTPEWSTVVWLPFAKYLEIADDLIKRVELPDGRSFNLAFGRLRHPLPGFDLRLVDFQMIAYDHRGSPRDYQSTVLVSPAPSARHAPEFEAFTHITKLNAPLIAPFHWDPERPWAANFFGRLASGVSPNQFKFSQAGWDAQMWKQTQQMADAGQIKRPFVRYTILGVGNNPGIHVIAAGSVLIALGIPWAFYIKPLIVQRKKRRIQAQVKAGTYVKPTRAGAPAERVPQEAGT